MKRKDEKNEEYEFLIKYLGISKYELRSIDTNKKWFDVDFSMKERVMASIKSMHLLITIEEENDFFDISIFTHHSSYLVFKFRTYKNDILIIDRKEKIQRLEKC